MATVLDSVALDIGFYPLSFGGCGDDHSHLK